MKLIIIGRKAYSSSMYWLSLSMSESPHEGTVQMFPLRVAYFHPMYCGLLNRTRHCTKRPEQNLQDLYWTHEWSPDKVLHYFLNCSFCLTIGNRRLCMMHDTRESSIQQCTMVGNLEGSITPPHLPPWNSYQDNTHQLFQFSGINVLSFFRINFISLLGF